MPGNRERQVYVWLVERGEPATIDVIARGLRMFGWQVDAPPGTQRSVRHRS